MCYIRLALAWTQHTSLRQQLTMPGANEAARQQAGIVAQNKATSSQRITSLISKLANAISTGPDWGHRFAKIVR